MKGARAHINRLKALASPEMKREVGRALFAAGELVQTEAQISITRGAVSGKGHVPSAPGEPPNADTHHLADNIETTQPAIDRVLVSSNATYSAPLEFGTSKMAARPFMRPARDKKRKEVQRMVQQAMNRVVRRSKRSD